MNYQGRILGIGVNALHPLGVHGAEILERNLIQILYQSNKPPVPKK